MLSLVDLLAALNEASADNGPWQEESGHAEELNGAFADFAKALAVYVEKAKALVPYEIVRSSLEDVVHSFPTNEEGDVNPFEQIEAALLNAMGLTKEEADELLGLGDGPVEEMGK
jgi:hypothetical protein